jgi:hypothetical protein
MSDRGIRPPNLTPPSSGDTVWCGLTAFLPIAAILKSSQLAGLRTIGSRFDSKDAQLQSLVIGQIRSPQSVPPIGGYNAISPQPTPPIGGC